MIARNLLATDLLATMTSDLFYIFRWDRHERKDQPCEVLAHGKMNSCLVRFEDGYTMVTSLNAVKRSQHRNAGAAAKPEDRNPTRS